MFFLCLWLKYEYRYLSTLLLSYICLFITRKKKILDADKVSISVFLIVTLCMWRSPSLSSLISLFYSLQVILLNLSDSKFRILLTIQAKLKCFGWSQFFLSTPGFPSLFSRPVGSFQRHLLLLVSLLFSYSTTFSALLQDPGMSVFLSF